MAKETVSKKEFDRVVANCNELNTRLNRQTELINTIDHSNRRLQLENDKLKQENQVLFARLLKIIKSVVNGVKFDGEDEIVKTVPNEYQHRIG